MEVDQIADNQAGQPAQDPLEASKQASRQRQISLAKGQRAVSFSQNYLDSPVS